MTSIRDIDNSIDHFLLNHIDKETELLVEYVELKQERTKEYLGNLVEILSFDPHHVNWKVLKLEEASVLKEAIIFLVKNNNSVLKSIDIVNKANLDQLFNEHSNRNKAILSVNTIIEAADEIINDSIGPWKTFVNLFKRPLSFKDRFIKAGQVQLIAEPSNQIDIKTR